MKRKVGWLRRLLRSKSEYSPEIGLSLDKATEFYLGMYRVEDEEHYGTCWLKQSRDGWRISINNYSLIEENTLTKRRFRPSGCTYFKTKEDAIEEFKKWVVVRAELLCNGSSGVHRGMIRSELTEFATEMEAVLRENDHKSGWDDLSIDDIFFRIKDEFEELDEAHAMYSHPLISDGETRSAIQDMRAEAIDLANFCMFLCHNYPKAQVNESIDSHTARVHR